MAPPSAHNNQTLETLLCQACSKGHLYVVQRLVEHGVNVNSQWSYPLSAAVEAGHVDVVEYLLKNKANPNCNRGYTSPLMRAVGSILDPENKIMWALLSHGADINARAYEDDGYTALMIAVDNGYTGKVCELMTSNTLDVGMFANDGVTTALSLAHAKGHPQIVKILQ